jgi:hypothetical protein
MQRHRKAIRTGPADTAPAFLARAAASVGLICIAFVVASCSNSESRQSIDNVTAESFDAAAGEASAANGVSKQENPSTRSIGSERSAVRREVVYTAVAEVEVRNASQEADRVRNQVQQADGWVLSDERVGNRAHLVLKVPPAKFDATLDALEQTGTVRSQRITASDVTAELVDLEARLKSAQISRDRLRTLLAEATKVDDLIALESELGQREATVEQILGQLQVLRSQVGYATVDLTLYERTVANVDDTNTTPAEGFRRGWVALQNTVTAVVVTVATLAAWIPVLALAGYGVRRIRLRRAARRSNTPKQGAGWTPPTVPVPGSATPELRNPNADDIDPNRQSSGT